MKKTIFTFLVMLTFIASNFAVNQNNWQNKLQQEGITENFEIPTSSLDKFLAMTPASYKEMTGKKLGFGKTLKLKAAQKYLKKNMNADGSADIPKGLYIVAVIFGWGFLVMGLMDDWSGNNWWVNLILTILCWLPGVIHGLIKTNEYY